LNEFACFAFVFRKIFLEIYQNCNIFNDGAFEVFTEKSSKKNETIFVEQGKPLIFGENNDKGIKLDGFTPTIVDLNSNGNSINDLWIHDEHDLNKAQVLVRFFENPKNVGHLPRPFGVFYETHRATYEDMMEAQIENAIGKRGKGNLDKLFAGNETWVIK